jgi:hypothetical protein
MNTHSFSKKNAAGIVSESGLGLEDIDQGSENDMPHAPKSHVKKAGPEGPAEERGDLAYPPKWMA